MGLRLVCATLVILLAGCSEGTYTPPETQVERPGPILYAGPWPILEDRPAIRPGAQVVTSDGGQCTSNFLFRTPDNATLYLGLAAHCFGNPGDLAIDTPLRVGGIQGAGFVAYNGWVVDDSMGNDFGLVRLSNSPFVRSNTHPAVMGWGGPTGLADQSTLQPGTQVISYGHSGQRSDTDPENVREGHIYVVNEDGSVDVMSNYPGIHGDSGSGLMDVQGRAIGVLSTKIEDPAGGALGEERDQPTINNYVNLHRAVQLAQESDPGLAGLEVVTWDLMDSPDSPFSPPGPLPDPPIL